MTLPRLRPTTVLAYDNCPRAYFYQYVQGIKPAATAANLVFGTAVHAACTGWLKAQADGRPFEPVQVFRQVWEQATATAAIDYPSTKSPAEFAAIGDRLAERFPAAWKATGLHPLIGPSAQPLIETSLQVDLGGGVILSGTPDVVAMDAAGDVVIVDIKTVTAPAAEGFVLVAEQLTAYQVLLETHAATLGIERVAYLGFLELIKRKPNGTKGPEVLPPVLAPRREPALLQEYLEKLRGTAVDLAQGRFPRRPRQAFNSPCTLCDFAGLCQRGDWTGLIRPGDAP